jgi:hypothetical protein
LTWASAIEEEARATRTAVMRERMGVLEGS